MYQEAAKDTNNQIALLNDAIASELQALARRAGLSIFSSEGAILTWANYNNDCVYQRLKPLLAARDALLAIAKK